VLWCCPNRVTKPFALLTIGILVAQAVSGPVAAAFLAMNGLGGLHGWQWLFLLEGLPTVVLSGVVWFWLPDCPSSVPWLTEGDKKLHEASVSDRNGGAFGGGGEVVQAQGTTPEIWMACMTGSGCFCQRVCLRWC
jgi:MFS family permease